MKWISHLAIAVAPVALISPSLMAATAAGAIAPDALERVINAKHRQGTHILIYWVIASLTALMLAFAVGGWAWHGAALMLGGLSHILLDSLTPTGVPLYPGGLARVHFFGGRVVTGSMTEYAITAVVVALTFAAWKATGGVAWLPFGWDWAGYFDRGLIDGHEWRLNRFRFF